MRYLSWKLFDGRLTTVVLILLGFLLFGIVGFMWIEHLTLIDALYMTVITLSTVGFGEINHDFSEEGRLFTIILILSGAGLFFYSISLLSEELLNGNFVRRYNNRRMEHQLAALSNHVIICGYGRNGKQAAETLLNHGTPIVILEGNQEVIDRYKGEVPAIFLHGDATDDAILRQGGIERALALIAALPSDADNLYAVLTGRQLNPNIKIISRASQPNSIRKLKIAGADNVVMPDKIGGQHMASIVVNPDLIEFLESLSVNQQDGVNLIEIASDDLHDEHRNLSLGEINIRSRTGCTVIGFKNELGEYLINPGDDTILKDNTFLIVLGRPSQITTLKKSYNLMS